ncbi:hypothetical protein ACFPRL_31420 [Pseudoclavibacter helvolus]
MRLRLSLDQLSAKLAEVPQQEPLVEQLARAIRVEHNLVADARESRRLRDEVAHRLVRTLAGSACPGAGTRAAPHSREHADLGLRVPADCRVL